MNSRKPAEEVLSLCMSSSGACFPFDRAVSDTTRDLQVTSAFFAVTTRLQVSGQSMG